LLQRFHIKLEGRKLLFVIAGIALAVGYYLNTNKASGSAAPVQQPFQSANPSGLPPAGTVTVAPRVPTLPYPSSGPSPSQDIALATGVATAGTAAAAGLGLIDSAGNLARGIPIAGAVIGIGLSIYSMIDAHHKAALAAEGKALNDAIPRAIQTYVLIMQGAAAKQITVAQAQVYCDHIVSDYYGEVKPIQRGLWPFDTDTESKHPPNPCNGACSVGHFHIERNRRMVMNCVADAWNGGHGICDFPQVNAHETQQGYPHTTVAY
jgi:hypothetical protein